MIRLTNLQAITKARGLNPGDLAKLAGRKPSYYSDLLRGKKSFGEKAARTLEQALDLPRNWLDQIHDTPEPGGLAEYRPTPDIKPIPANDAAAPLMGESNQATLSVTKIGRAPVVVWARLGVDLIRNNDEWTEQHLAPFVTNRPIGPRCKLIKVEDNTLSPRIIAGDLVCIDPDNKTPRRDKVALFKAPDGAYLLRIFRPLVNGEFEAVDSNGGALDSTRHGLIIAGTHVCTIPSED